MQYDALFYTRGEASTKTNIRSDMWSFLQEMLLECLDDPSADKKARQYAVDFKAQQAKLLAGSPSSAAAVLLGESGVGSGSGGGGSGFLRRSSQADLSQHLMKFGAARFAGQGHK